MLVRAEEIINKSLGEAYSFFAEHEQMQKLLFAMSLACCHDLKGITLETEIFCDVLTEKGIKLFETNYETFFSQITTLDPLFKAACSAGCSYCCSSHISVMPQEVFRIAKYLEQNLDGLAYSELTEKCTAASRSLNDCSAADFAGNYFQSCPFLKDGNCSIYEVRPIVCRNWISTDVAACIASHESGNTITVPQNSLLMLQKDLIYAGQEAFLDTLGIAGGIGSFLPMMSVIMKDYEGAYARWIAGRKLTGQF